MLKAVLFDIEDKKDDQRKAESAMSPAFRLSLCLDIIDLSIALSPTKFLKANPDDHIDWIELYYKNA